MDCSSSQKLNLFARYRNEKLIEVTQSGEIGNVDYSVYKKFRGIIKGHAIHHFPKLFSDDKKFRIKRVEAVFEKEKILFRKVSGYPVSYSLAQKVQPFLSSVTHFKFKGKTRNSQQIPAGRLGNAYDDYFKSSRELTNKALIETYEKKYGVEVDLNAFTCPLSQTAPDQHRQVSPQLEHIEDEKDVESKLWAAVYLLNEFNTVDESGHLKEHFFDIKLKFAKGSNSSEPKQFLFAKKQLFVEILSDVRNLMFLCSSCNHSKPKSGGWVRAMDQERFEGIVDVKLREKMIERSKQPGSMPESIIDFKITQQFRRAVLKKFPKDKEEKQDFDNLIKQINIVAKKSGKRPIDLAQELRDKLALEPGEE